MKPEAVLKEMVEVASREKQPQETELLSRVALHPGRLRFGCQWILIWLRNQSDRLTVEPMKLDPSFSLDRYCIRLIEAADFLREFIEVREGYLTFSEKLTPEQIRAMLVWVKENYHRRSRIMETFEVPLPDDATGGEPRQGRSEPSISSRAATSQRIRHT